MCNEQTQYAPKYFFQCPKPVIVAIHNACVGAGVDLVSACDIRYVTQDAWFQIKVPHFIQFAHCLDHIKICISLAVASLWWSHRLYIKADVSPKKLLFFNRLLAIHMERVFTVNKHSKELYYFWLIFYHNNYIIIIIRI